MPADPTPAMARRRLYAGRQWERAVTVFDLRERARRRLPRFVFEYMEGGAEAEQSLAFNREVFSELFFVPDALSNAIPVSAASTLFGQPMRLPLVVAPTGFNGLLHADGDRLLAEAASAFEIPFVQSTVSNAPIEDIAALPGIRHWQQLYMFRSDSFTERFVARAREAGSQCLVVTVDGTAFGNREWDRRNYRKPMVPTLANALDILRHPSWATTVMRPGLPMFVNILDFLPPGERTFARSANWSREQVEPDLGWEHVRRLRALWPRKLVVKGLLSVADALKAEQCGADGIVLSNHGGRQLDGAISPMTVLPEVAKRLKGRIAILVDSGFRRGTDVVKALAAGADAVMIGRAALYGLAAGGRPGAERAFEILQEEILRTLALVGRRDLAALGPDCLVRRGQEPLPPGPG